MPGSFMPGYDRLHQAHARLTAFSQFQGYKSWNAQLEEKKEFCFELSIVDTEVE